MELTSPILHVLLAVLLAILAALQLHSAHLAYSTIWFLTTMPPRPALILAQVDGLCLLGIQMFVMSVQADA